MHIENVIINIGSSPSAMLQAVTSALLRGADLREPGSQPAPPAPATGPIANPPPIGEYWPGHGGIYCGVSRGEDGQPDAHIVLLEAIPATNLSWENAVKWAEGLGNGARLPTRFESALLYANLHDKLEKEYWNWTGTQFSASSAVYQFFGYGGQGNSDKKSKARARAVRLVQLSA
ncbi:MAG: hypothetical protein I8H91_11085 [Burkholderiales bacterium]|nr:hypothetical protein [Burkholderiales bacterium]